MTVRAARTTGRARASAAARTAAARAPEVLEAPVAIRVAAAVRRWGLRRWVGSLVLGKKAADRVVRVVPEPGAVLADRAALDRAAADTAALDKVVLVVLEPVAALGRACLADLESPLRRIAARVDLDSRPRRDVVPVVRLLRPSDLVAHRRIVDQGDPAGPWQDVVRAAGLRGCATPMTGVIPDQIGAAVRQQGEPPSPVQHPVAGDVVPPSATVARRWAVAVVLASLVVVPQ